MSFLIDTDFCSAYLKGDHRVWQRFMQHGGRLSVSVITVGELFTWTLRAKASPKRLEALLHLLGDVTILDVTSTVARKFGEMRAVLLDTRHGTPEMDLLIAATALVKNLTLVTHNVQDFENLPGLTVVDWFENQ